MRYTITIQFDDQQQEFRVVADDLNNEKQSSLGYATSIQGTNEIVELFAKELVE